MDTQVIAGRYHLERRLGVGGMSEVWAAEDLELDRTVAVKLLAPEADPARFEREARAAAGLSHPNICALYDYGEDGRRWYMVLEYLPGGTLEERLAPGRPLTDADTERIAREIAAGLAHAHGRGLVHRDLKPSNILFDVEGRAKIADFGIVHMDAATGLTEAGTVLGTAAYISPEQAAGEPATPASDVYAFGVILFRMLTGRLPFEAPDALTVAAMHRDQQPPPVSELRADAPPLLESLATAALAKRPADRPTDGRALLAELGLPPDDTAVTTVLAVPPPASSKRKRTVLFAIAVAVLAAAGIALAVGLGSDNNGPTAPAPTSNASVTSRPATTTSPVFTPAPSPAETTSTEAATSSTTTTTAAATTATTAPATTTPPTTTTTPATTIAPPTTTAATTTSTDATTTTTATETTATTPATTAAVTETAPPG